MVKSSAIFLFKSVVTKQKATYNKSTKTKKDAYPCKLFHLQGYEECVDTRHLFPCFYIKEKTAKAGKVRKDENTTRENGKSKRPSPH